VAKILTADDAGFVRRWCARVLGDAGHEVVEAVNGDEAIVRYKQHRPDAVLLDVLMPGMDGLAVLKELRSFDPDARIAMLTTQGQIDIVVEARKLGAKDFIVKPCDADRLLAALDRILS
jgi:two-component system chemotaxis response regulator CheY